MRPWIPLATFAADRQADVHADWRHPLGAAHSALPRTGVEEMVDTITALQRAEWLADGVYVGEHSYSAVNSELIACSRRLGVSPPPAIVGPIAGREQRLVGSDARPFMHLSSFFMSSATPAERRFVLARLLSPIATRSVTSDTAYALLVDDGGLRQLARRSLGPTVEVALAPLSLATRLVWSRSHRASEITADRAGLLCAGSLDDAGRAPLRIALGVTPLVQPDAYLAQLDQHADGAPGRWAELLASSPWTHKRIRALKLYARSAAYGRAMAIEPPHDALSDDALNRAVSALLGGPAWST